jgi:hypothetical protein
MLFYAYVVFVTVGASKNIVMRIIATRYEDMSVLSQIVVFEKYFPNILGGDDRVLHLYNKCGISIRWHEGVEFIQQ